MTLHAWLLQRLGYFLKVLARLGQKGKSWAIHRLVAMWSNLTTTLPKRHRSGDREDRPALGTDISKKDTPQLDITSPSTDKISDIGIAFSTDHSLSGRVDHDNGGLSGGIKRHLSTERFTAGAYTSSSSCTSSQCVEMETRTAPSKSTSQNTSIKLSPSTSAQSKNVNSPFSNIFRNATRSTQSLRSARKSHLRAIEAYNTVQTQSIISHNHDSINPGEIIISNPDEEGVQHTVTIEPVPPTPPSATPTSQLQSFYQSSNSSIRPSCAIDITGMNKTQMNPDLINLDMPTRSSSRQSGSSIASVRSMYDVSITPVMPEATQRYTRKPRIRREDSLTPMKIQPLPVDWDEEDTISEWTEHVHIEGARYFYNKEKRITTEADLSNREVLEQINAAIAQLEVFAARESPKSFQKQNDDDIHLFVDTYYDDERNTNTTTYYYAHHSLKSIFFLDEIDAEIVPSWWEIDGRCSSKGHLRHAVHAQYWYFIQLYPHALPSLTESMITEIRGLLRFLIADAATSNTSTTPFTGGEMRTYLDALSNIENADLKDNGVKCLFARVMYLIVHSRFLNFHGEPHARIERTFCVYEDDKSRIRTGLIKVLSPCLFFCPDYHSSRVQFMLVDDLLYKSLWQEVTQKLIIEWQGYVILTTVILAVDISFLTIQSVDINEDPYRSPAQISGYLSIVACMGSVITGLILTQEIRNKMEYVPDEAQRFLQRVNHPRFGHEILCIILSLPYALLMWGIVLFSVGMAFLTLHHSNIIARSLVGLVSFIVLILVMWCIRTFWKKDDSFNVQKENSENMTTNDKPIGRSIIPTKFFSKVYSLLMSTKINRAQKESGSRV